MSGGLGYPLTTSICPKYSDDREEPFFSNESSIHLRGLTRQIVMHFHQNTHITTIRSDIMVRTMISTNSQIHEIDKIHEIHEILGPFRGCCLLVVENDRK